MNDQDTILEETPASMLAKVGDDTMAEWNDEKKQEFVGLFEKRSKAAQYILQKSATIIIERAESRHFIGVRTAKDLKAKAEEHGLYDSGNSYHDRRNTVGSRTVGDLDLIAEERARLILDELPPIREAVQVIDPDTSKMMGDRDKLVTRLKKLKEKLEELPNRLNMRDPQFKKMLVGDFLKFVSTLEKERGRLASEMSDVGRDGQVLDEIINKRLYNGLPGLSDAVKKVAIQHIERAKALDATTRRVEEKVKFGDDEGAVELLKGFEKDEVSISDNVKAEFAAALKKLNLATKRKPKKLTKGKKAKK